MTRIQSIQLALASYAAARVLFHLCAMMADKEVAYHVAGILREFN